MFTHNQRPFSRQNWPIEYQICLVFRSPLYLTSLVFRLSFLVSAFRSCFYSVVAEKKANTFVWPISAPRHNNFRTWFYRIRPSVHHTPFERFDQVAPLITHDWNEQHPNPNQVSQHLILSWKCRWDWEWGLVGRVVAIKEKMSLFRFIFFQDSSH
jgi:hypothetical protein